MPEGEHRDKTGKPRTSRGLESTRRISIKEEDDGDRRQPLTNSMVSHIFLPPLNLRELNPRLFKSYETRTTT